MRNKMITNIILDRAIFNAWWFRALDNLVDQDPSPARKELAWWIFAIPFTVTVLCLWLLRALEAEELVGRSG